MSTRIPLAGVLGSPIAHSRSPLLHGHWLRVHGLAGHYVPLHVEPEDLAEVLRLLPRMGFRGVNVTLPHKEAALRLADTATDSARAIGAANTLTFGRNDAIHADNTDAPGFMASLYQQAPQWRADLGPVAVLGAGGASRAVIWALLAAGVPALRLANRTRDRAEAMARTFGARVEVCDWSAAPAMLEGVSLVVNATSLGMTGKPPLDLGLERLAAGAVACDLVYTPLETPFLAAARARGAVCVDGLGMLLHQGVPGFEAWFGQRPAVDAATRAAVLGP